MAKPRGRKLLKKQQDSEFVPNTKRERDEESYKEDTTSNGNDERENGSDPQMFFGVLDREELEYFKQIEATLAMNTFETADEKQHLIENVLQEAKGKELKLATSQICSKLMERIILDCNDEQLKSVFKSFNGFFYNLSCHKYASHVLETLFVRSAALIENELVTPNFDDATNGNADDESKEVVGSMENMFLFMLNELKPHSLAMMSHQYASHSLRLLILILSSKKLPSATKSNSTLRSKKSKIARKMIDIKDNNDFDKVYQTPESFKIELRSLLDGLYKLLTKNATSRSEISTTVITKFRELCVEKVASPVIQLVIQVEGIFDRDRSFWRLAFCTTDEKDTKEEAFVEYLLSDPVGSHFLENAIGFTRTKYAERLYRLYMKDRISKLAKRDTTGAFVVQALLKNLKIVYVEQILADIIPELSILLNSNMSFGTAIIEASNKSNFYMRTEVIEQLIKKYYSDESENKNILESCLQLSTSTLGNTKDDWPTAEERRNALFLEKLINYDEKFLEITIESLLALPEERVLQMCYHGVFSHVIECVLQPAKVDFIKRKLLLNVLCKDVVNMACNAYGSHIVDKLWSFTAKLMLYKERIATALCGETEKVKNSTYGRQVWKNWSLELFIRKRWDWKGLVKQNEQEIFPPTSPSQQKKDNHNNSDKKSGSKKRPFSSRNNSDFRRMRI